MKKNQGLSGINLKKYGSKYIRKWEIKSVVTSGKELGGWKWAEPFILLMKKQGIKQFGKDLGMSFILRICTMQDLKQQREKSGHIPEIQYPRKPLERLKTGVREQISNGGRPAVRANTDPFLSLHVVVWKGISWSRMWLQPYCVRYNYLEKGWKYSAIKQGK